MAGIDEPDGVDLIAEVDGVAVLVMVEDRAWDLGLTQREQLMLKIDSYANFVHSGQLAAMYLSSEGLPVVLELSRRHDPPQSVLEVLFTAAEVLTPHSLSVRFEVRA